MRIRQDTPDADIYYFGGVEWSWDAASTSDTEARIYLNAPSGRVGLHLKDASLAPSETRYFHTDHLGSIELVTNHLGEVIDRLSYSPWGQRRQDVWTHGNSFHKGVERRGFTGHEHLAYADFELIHMNGRVYDPVLARFVSGRSLCRRSGRLAESEPLCLRGQQPGQSDRSERAFYRPHPGLCLQPSYHLDYGESGAGSGHRRPASGHQRGRLGGRAARSGAWGSRRRHCPWHR